MTNASSTSTTSLERRILQREILKYGGSLTSDLGLSQGVSASCNTLTPQLASDATLTGLAQLAALRMNAKHGFISLIDDKFQHMLAEATRSVSPFDFSIHDPGDDLVVGVQTLDLEFGICPVTLAAFSKGSDHWIDTDITYADEHKYVISDLVAEPRVNKARFMEGNHTSRFYAEVPLRNSQGMIIGSVSVIDNAPRSNPSQVDVRALEDIALMTMDHFELIRIKEVSHRAERLMQGLGHFNLGKSSISQWIMNNAGRPATNTGKPYGVPTDSPFLTPNIAEDTPTPMSGPPSSVIPLMTPSVTMEGSGYFDHKPNKIIPLEPQMPKPEVPRLQKTSQMANGVDTGSRDSHRQPEFAPSRVPVDIKDAFARASNLIRESMDLDATCFLEISPSALLNTRARKNSVVSVDYGSSTSSPPCSTKPEATSVVGRPDLGKRPSHASASKVCSRLGLSLRNGSHSNEEDLDLGFATFPESSLCKLAYEFSAGGTFNFDAFGSLAAVDEALSSHKSALRRKKLSDLMIRHFPDARSLIFMPLYDNETRHLYAGFFGWTTDPRRVLQSNEAVYVLGFANSVMCEVMRLETLAVEKAKTDFMSSMSHELRSPLHGILGATQLLQESELPQAQSELAMMIDSCGRTLLDIMNNLLEHAKINNITNARRVRMGQGHDRSTESGRRVSAPENDGTAEVVNLASLVEETVTSVAAGHSVRQQRSEQTSTRRASQRTFDPDTFEEDEIDEHGLPLPPSVIITIPSQSSWLYETEAGSWRRVVMNLVGNALKYTQRGHIKVSLRPRNTTNPRNGLNGVVLVVEDTGQGISETYLRTRLYTPFAQEDNLSVGAGLGLSIVNRLVEALGGTIQIESEVDVGTKVTVCVATQHLGPSHPLFARSNSMIGFDTVRVLIEPHRAISFIGFDIASTTQSSKRKPPSRQRLSLCKLEESLTELGSTWFRTEATNKLEEAAIVFVEERHARRLLNTNPSHVIFKKRYIVVSAQHSTAPKMADWPGCCNFLAAPAGPVKLSRALNTTLQQDLSNGHTGAMKRRHSSEESLPGTNGIKRDQAAKKAKLTGATPDRSPSTKEASRTLLVEDNAINLKLLASFVRRLGFPYVTATNGQEALDEYTSSFERGAPIRYVLMDITMPVMDGISATRHIRAFENSKDVEQPAEIIALTGLGHVEAQAEAMASGVDQYFCKPVKLNQLKKLLM